MIARLGVAASTAAVVALGICTQASGLTPPVPEKADLVFSSRGRIVTMKADGTGRTILTHEGEPFDSIYQNEDSSPEISPDGTKLLFWRYKESRDFDSVSQIVLIDRDGGSQKVLREGHPGSAQTYVTSPAWSPDSSKVFYIRYGEGRRTFSTEVRSIRTDGTEDRLITRSTMRVVKGKVTGAKALPVVVAPSPTGGQLLVSYSPLFGEKPTNIFLMNPASGKRRLLERDASSGAWSPDGSRIVFVSERDHLNKRCYESSCSYDAQIYVMKADGSAVRRLIPGKIRGSSYSPDWSADGTRIVFSSDRLAPGSAVADEIFSISPAGKCLTRLTNGSPSSGSATWGPGASLPADPGICGDAAPRALAEYTPGPAILALKLPPLWLGPRYGNRLLSSLFKDGRNVTTGYEDCGSLKAGRCSLPVQTTSGPVCEKHSDSVFYDGTFRRLVRRNGALVMLSEPSGGGLDTIVYSGGIETGIHTREKYRGRNVRPADHLAVVDQLRPVTSAEPPGSDLDPAVFTLDEVKKARAVLRAFEDEGTLTEAAADQNMFPQLAHAYLRFGKALDRIGKVLTVKCKGRSAVPGSVKLR